MANALLSDGFVSLCVDGSQNVFAGRCRVLVEGQMLAAGTAIPDVLRPVTSVRGVDALFGQGSVMAESLKKLFCQCPSNLEVFVIPRQDNAAGVIARYNLTVTGTATSPGRIEIFFMDRDYSIDIGVSTGDTPAVIAAAILAAIPANFPYTGAIAANVIGFQSRHRGTIGNNLNAVVNWRGRADYAPAGVTVSVVQTAVGVGSPVPLDYKTILGECCYSCFAILNDDVTLQNTWIDYLKTLWDCATPQCFGHAYMPVTGTLGQILAKTVNAEVASMVVHGPLDPTSSYFKTIAYAALSCCTGCSNPELSIQGRTNGVLSCIKIPASCTQEFTFDEQAQLKAAGFVVSGPLDGGLGSYTSPYIYNDVTNSLYDADGKPNATYRDTNSRRLVANTGLQLAARLLEFSGLALFTKDTTIRKGTFGTNPKLMLGEIRAWAKSQVGILFSSFDSIDSDITLTSDLDVAPKCQGDPGKLHLRVKYSPPVRISTIRTTLAPSLIGDCS
jgi:hypothetical protein